MYVDDLRIVAPRVLRSAQLPAWLPGGPVLDERSHERRRNTEHECSFPRGSQYMLDIRFIQPSRKNSIVKSKSKTRRE
jgi:hypothetical protein